MKTKTNFNNSRIFSMSCQQTTPPQHPPLAKQEVAKIDFPDVISLLDAVFNVVSLLKRFGLCQPKPHGIDSNSCRSHLTWTPADEVVIFLISLRPGGATFYLHLRMVTISAERAIGLAPNYLRYTSKKLLSLLINLDFSTEPLLHSRACWTVPGGR